MIEDALKIKITGCKYPEEWYSDKINETFEALKCGRGYYVVNENNLPNTLGKRYVYSFDCVVIE